MAAANAQIGVATAAFFPRLAPGRDRAATRARGSRTGFLCRAASGRSGRRSSRRSSTAASAGAGTEQARATYDAAVAVYRQDVLTAFQDVEDNLAALRILAEEAAQQAAAVAAAERSLDDRRNRYLAGTTTYLEVVTAQTIALSNERTAVEIQTRRMTAAVNLIKALGGGWRASDLPYGGTGRRPWPRPDTRRRVRAPPAPPPQPRY